MAAKRSPQKIEIRAYNVGFGDCLLMSLQYGGNMQRHVLIDCGSTRAPESKKNKPEFLLEVAEDIRSVSGGKLTAIVATHRHRDHISGFAPGPGDVFRELNPEVVIQPWTEDPDAPEASLGPMHDPGQPTKAVAGFRQSLAAMHMVAKSTATYARDRLKRRPRLARQLEFLGEENIANRPAVENLMKMGKDRKYVYFGSKSGLDALLPGVKTHVLGPPTLKQSESIRRQTDKNDHEFWHLYRGFTSFWGFQAATAKRVAGQSLLRGIDGRKPGAADRWFVDRLRAMQDDNMLSIVTQLDEQMNNTSVILLFEVGGKRLLFPGDAQLENWMFALKSLEDAGRISMLEDVDFYKVGHHGSLNATPKSLWAKFRKKGAQKQLQTVLSTRPGMHGSSARHTEVPRSILVKELQAQSRLTRTDDIRASEGVLCRLIEIPL